MTYSVSGSGTVTNNTTASIDNVVVNWTVTYQNGSTASTSTPIGGQTLTKGSSATWSAAASGGPSASPPVQVAVNSISFSYTNAPARCPT